AGGHALELVRVVLELRERGEAADEGGVGADHLGVLHAPALGGHVAGDIAHVLAGGGDLDVDPRLQQRGAGLLDGVHEGLAASGDEGDFLAIYGVVLAVGDVHADADHGVAGDRAVVHDLADTLLD